MRAALFAIAAIVGIVACNPPPSLGTTASAPALAPAPAPAQAPVASAPAAPPYDLAADRDQRLLDARRELGATIPATIEADVFVVAGPGAPGTVDFIRRTLAAYFHGRFDKRPARAISVYMFASAAPYEAYCKTSIGEACFSPFGFYLPSRRLIVMNAGPGIGTLSHELVHPIVETDFPDAPTWLDEGIASLFEAPVLARSREGAEIHGAKNWRWPRLVAALGTKAEKDEVRLDALFGMSNTRFRGDAERLHYASARYVCQWLDARGQLWPFYRAWRDGKASDPTGEKSFLAVTGKTPRDANEEWTAWVKRL